MSISLRSLPDSAPGIGRSPVALARILTLTFPVLSLLASCGQAADKAKPPDQPPSFGQVRSALSGGQETTSRYLVDYADVADDYEDISGVSGVQSCSLPNLDDGYASINFPTGFNFYYYDSTTAYTSVYVSANGFLKFGAAPSSLSYFNYDVVSASAEPSAIFAWWDDLVLPDTSSCEYVAVGTSPNRIFKVQWSNARNYIDIYDNRNPMPLHSFQVWLREGSNDIEIIRAPLMVSDSGTDRPWHSGDPVTGSASLGLSDEVSATTGSADVRLFNCTVTGACSENDWTNFDYPTSIRFFRPPFRYITTQSAITYTADATGTQVLPDGGDPDDGFALVSLPAPFVYYGKVFNQVYVSANGFLSFDTPTSGLWGNNGIPYPFSPFNLVAGWWDDMILESVSDLRYRTSAPCMGCDPNQIIFEWNNWHHYDPTQSGNLGATVHQMRIILNLLDSRIEFQYGAPTSATTSLDSATVGLIDSKASARSRYALTTCGGDCAESDWPANQSIVLTKPTWTYLYNQYFTQYGDQTLHCGKCHSVLRNATNDAFLSLTDTYSQLFQPWDVPDDTTIVTMVPFDDMVPTRPPSNDTHAFIVYGTNTTEGALMMHHDDGRIDPLSTLLSVNRGTISWFTTGSNMPWDYPHNYFYQGMEELQAWFADGAQSN